MMSTDRRTPPLAPEEPIVPRQITRWQRVKSVTSVKSVVGQLSRAMWLCLFLACLGASWFAYHYLLVPQPVRYAPNWGNAQWVQAVNSRNNGTTPVAYFRYVTYLNAAPQGAFVTVTASQTFRLYVNGIFVGSNAADFVQGEASLAYMYDVGSLLQVGQNALAVRVANVDQQVPAVRVNMGIVRGTSLYSEGSGAGWQATTDSATAHPRYVTNATIWATVGFDASAWPPIQKFAGQDNASQVALDPQLYTQPQATHWLSAGVDHEAYFVRQISVPLGNSDAWLRVVASGTAQVFINGHLVAVWNNHASIPRQSVADYLSNSKAVGRFRRGYEVGVYTIAPYLHVGSNTVAVHVLTPGITSAQAGLTTLSAAMSADVLLTDGAGHANWVSTDSGWHTSGQAVAGWTQGSDAALHWTAPTTIARPGGANVFYLPDSDTAHVVGLIPVSHILAAVVGSSVVVLGLWLLMSFLVIRRYTYARKLALETMSLAYLPALAAEAVLLALSREPQFSPFPYTWLGAGILLVLVGMGFLLLVWHARNVSNPTTRVPVKGTRTMDGDVRSSMVRTPLAGVLVPGRLLQWLRTHWGLVLIVVIAIPLICFNLGYEPYWQDELTSYYAAKGILAHGIPVLPSGFLYPKGELYSYLLALSMLLFGDQGWAPRILSVLEYLVSLPVLYIVGCYFFERRIALLATAMLALSPIALVWGREVRMYEQVQVLTPLVLYLFYKALQDRQRVRAVYIAVGCLVLNYLSHEETFIILPGMVLCVLMASTPALVGKASFVGVIRRRLPWVLTQKHWWFAAAVGVALIGTQLLIVVFSHPALLGTDQSQRPLIQLTTDNIPYYFKLLFFPTTLGNQTPWLTLNSILAVAGCVWAFRCGDMRAKYCALFLIMSFITLVFVFTLASERYIYPVLPIYYLMGAAALVMGLQRLWAFVRPRVTAPVSALAMGRADKSAVGAIHRPLRVDEAPMGAIHRPMRWVLGLTMGLVLACVLLVPMLPLSNYNLFVSRVTGQSYHRQYPDYDAVGQYMQQHMQKGDVVIAVSPAISVLYYVGHVNYFLSVNRALYLFELNGHIIDTPTGSIALLNQADFASVLASHTRVWLVSDNGLYQAGALKDGRFVYPPDFHLVFEGYGSALYFRGS